MGAKEINVFFLSLLLTVLLLVMAIYFVIIAIRRRQIYFLKEKENAELLHRQQLLETRNEVQQTLMQNLGAELHDTVGQKLTLAYLQMENALQINEIAPLKIKVATQNNLIQEALDELRSLSKILVSHDFANFSFVHFLQKEMSRLQQSGLCNAVFIYPETIPSHNDERVELTLARICQEFIQNSLKYSGGDQITIQLSCTDQNLQVLCSDNGIGIDIAKLQQFNIKSGSGIQNIEKRVVLIGATCQWFNSNGTQLQITVPFTQNSTL